jgi:hypothetical protein
VSLSGSKSSLTKCRSVYEIVCLLNEDYYAAFDRPYPTWRSTRTSMNLGTPDQSSLVESCNRENTAKWWAEAVASTRAQCIARAKQSQKHQKPSKASFRDGRNPLLNYKSNAVLNSTCRQLFEDQARMQKGDTRLVFKSLP